MQGLRTVEVRASPKARSVDGARAESTSPALAALWWDMAKQPLLRSHGRVIFLSVLFALVFWVFALLSGRSSLVSPCSLCAHSSSVGVRCVLARCLLLLFGCSLCARPVLALVRHKGIRMAVSGTM